MNRMPMQHTVYDSLTADTICFSGMTLVYYEPMWIFGGSIVNKNLDEVIEDKHLIPSGEILVGQIDFDELLAEIRF